MFFWLFVTAIVLLIAYRKEISARYENWAARLIIEAQYEVFHVVLHPRIDADIVEFLRGIGCLSVYYQRLIDCDLGKLSRKDLAEKCPERDFARNSAGEVENVELRLSRELNGDEIEALKNAKPSINKVMTQLVREDMEYRKEQGLLLAPALEQFN